MKHTVPVLLAAALGAAAPAAAQESTPLPQAARGFFVEGHGTFVRVDRDGAGEAEAGLGGGGTLGYAFHERVAVFLSVDNAALDEYEEQSGGLNATHADLGLRLGWQPEGFPAYLFGEVAVTGRLLSFEDARLGDESFDLDVSGAGVTLGVGAMHFFRPDVALIGGLRLTSGDMDHAEVEESELTDGGEVTAPGFTGDMGSGRIHFGVAWFPGRRDPRSR